MAGPLAQAYFLREGQLVPIASCGGFHPAGRNPPKRRQRGVAEGLHLCRSRGNSKHLFHNGLAKVSKRRSDSHENFSRKISSKVPHLVFKSPTLEEIFLEKFPCRAVEWKHGWRVKCLQPRGTRIS